MNVNKLYNATESAEYLGVHRPRFYEIITEYKLKEAWQTGRVKFYSIDDLKPIRKALNAK